MAKKKIKKKKRKMNKWQKHVQKTSKANKGMGFGAILKKAKSTYK